MPSVMVALPNIAGALCSTPQSPWDGLADELLGCHQHELYYRRHAGNAGLKKIAKKSPSGHHRTILSGYIFATKARIDNLKQTC